METVDGGLHERGREFIERIHQHVILKFDFDGVIVDSEKIAAAVTVTSVNKYLSAHFSDGKFEPLTELYVYKNLSGLNFEKQQIPKIEEMYGIKFPPQLIEDKKLGNLTALQEETEVIHGIEIFFDFIRKHRLNAIGVTQSDPGRVLGTLLSPLCEKIVPHLTTSLNQVAYEGSNKILLLSAGAKFEWRGRVIEQLKSKPDPEGYDLAHEIASARTPEIDDIPTIVFEDSDMGAQAALAHIDHARDKIGIVSLGGHVGHAGDDHVDQMLAIVGRDRAVVITHAETRHSNPWTPGVLAALQLALTHARLTAKDLPEKLPPFVEGYVIQEMNAGL